MSHDPKEQERTKARILSMEYKEEVPCSVIKVVPSAISAVLRKCRSYRLDVKRPPTVVEVPASTSFFSLALPSSGTYVVVRRDTPKDIDSSAPIDTTLTLHYNYFTYNELLKKAIGDNCQTSYNKVGHIIHLNLNDEVLEHKHFIASVILSKVKDAKTVIRKASSISAVFRNFEIEHLAGLKAYQTTQKENGLTFLIDYDKVYWNTKLQQERLLLVSQFKKGESLCDLFCGVGPFSLPSLAKGLTVYANDLNPNSISNLKQNLVLNKSLLPSTPSLSIYNADAKDFLLQSFQDLNRGKDHKQPFNHYILNLPSLSTSFLPHFLPIYRQSHPPYSSTIHLYLFSPPQTTLPTLAESIEKTVNIKLTSPTLRHVRNVSPSKHMYLLSFPLSSFSSFAN